MNQKDTAANVIKVATQYLRGIVSYEDFMLKSIELMIQATK